ncbi:MAG TPA: DUF1345 domain-containing protein [Beijerinckiaceae bacterium]|nr:DUF1345 domain-containing protein [Beijerinckiaceae bacterium]
MTQSVEPKRAPSRIKAFRILRSRPRLFICFALAILVGVVQPHDWRAITRLLIAWNVGVWSYLISASLMMFRATPESIRRRAELQDEGRLTLLVLASASAVASVGAILAQLAAVAGMTGEAKALRLALAGSTIVSAWLFIHMIFALHYAHEYFLERRADRDQPAAQRGGLTFPGTPSPDYVDFLYFSYIIGVASQTADVAICSKTMRRVSLAHSIVSFFFNTTILALTINIAAGLV